MDASLVPQEILDFYSAGGERARLDFWHGRLEFARTQELLLGQLPPPPAAVLDVGGGAGHYSRWLTGLGYDVRMIDPVPGHVEAAVASGVAAETGDARSLPFQDGSIDVVLLLGPLYHMADRDQRLLALREARRVLRPNGLLAAAAISRFASMLAGLHQGELEIPAFRAMADRALDSGLHQPPPGRRWFTTAYFHTVEELESEVRDAGFVGGTVFGVEGSGWLIPPEEFERRWAAPHSRETILWAARRIESEPTMVSVSSHLLGLARKGA